MMLLPDAHAIVNRQQERRDCLSKLVENSKRPTKMTTLEMKATYVQKERGTRDSNCRMGEDKSCKVKPRRRIQRPFDLGYNQAPLCLLSASPFGVVRHSSPALHFIQS
ncbi:unnamed protein product [Caenorhabditis auriculariae]|uniref:Uncharacterized protein n=1 Tax=Caenorhabditis auriculariae TaxID=2777116 RepID=A0A8S1GYA2_9PELO|nr:unnamed protein product [Caenorhabditis auriculariae]